MQSLLDQMTAASFSPEPFPCIVLLCESTGYLEKNRVENSTVDDIGYYDIVITIKTYYFTILAWCFALAQAALAGEAGTAAVEQRTQSFTIILNGSVSDVTPLFGPVREAEWAPEWSPRFIHPAQGVQREGVVFTTSPGRGKDRLWLLTTYDVENGRVEYAVVTPAFTANEIKIHVVPYGEHHCKATITYRRSALALEGNEEVAKLDTHWAEEQRIHWETAINEALAKGGIHD